MANLKDLIVTGNSSFTGNVSVTGINGVTVGESPKFTDTQGDWSVTDSSSPAYIRNKPEFGKKLLEENLVSGTNTLTQAMLSDTDTIYSIAYDYVCDSNITIPSNCVLEFNGGSVTGGNITLQGTYLNGDVNFSGTTISGSCANSVLTPQMFGAYPSLGENESNKTQHTLAFENLIRVLSNQSTLSKTVHISGGHYAINKKLTIEVSCKIYGDGNLSTLDFYEGKGALYFGKTSGLFETLNCTIIQDASKFDKKIVVDDNSELNVDDYIIIVDTVDKSFNDSRAYYRTCECLRIRTIDNNNIYFDSSLYGYYFVNYGENETTSITPAPAHRTVISKFYPNTYNISDINLHSHTHQNNSPSTYYTLRIEGFENSEFNNVNVENYGNSVAAATSYGLDYKINRSVFRSYTKYTGDAYGLVINHSQNFYVNSSTFRANSHALATGGGTGLTAINNRNFIYDNLYFETSEKFSNNLDEDYGYIDLDVHANAEYYKFINISAPHTSCDTGGYNAVVEGCKFYRITPTFNSGDFCIRKCEMFGNMGNFLMSNYDIKNNNGHNSLIIEDSIIHGRLEIDLQDSSLTGKIYDYFVIKNNIFHNHFRIRNGRINLLSLSNNIFTHGMFLTSTESPMEVINLSVKDNTFQDGQFNFYPMADRITEGVISGNTFILKTAYDINDVRYVVSLRSFKGNLVNNVIFSYLDDGYELVSITNHSDVQIFDNFFQKGYGSTPKALVISIGFSNVILERNKHNSLRTTLVNVTEYSSGKSKSFSDYNNTFVSENQKWQSFSSDNILGKTSYIKKTNTLLYAGCRRKGPRVTMLGVFYQGTGNTDIKPNTLTYGKSYILSVNNSGSDLYYLYFSKYNVGDTNFSEDNMVCVLSDIGVETDYVFNALDPETYPYIYAKTTSSSVHIFSIYENNIVCEYDSVPYGTLRIGTTAQRPSSYDIYTGFKYYDMDLNKELIASEFVNNKVYWRETDGAIAGVKRTGTTSERPTGIYNATPSNVNYARANIYVGFKYIDTTIGKEIYASAIDGNTVTWTEISGDNNVLQIEYQYN